MNILPNLKVGTEHSMSYLVPENKVVPQLYPEAEEFQSMPKVFATGFAVGLAEWCCMKLINSNTQMDDHITLGANLDIVHCYPAIPGANVDAWCRLVRAADSNLLFKVRLEHNGETLLEGTHLRSVVMRTEFDALLDTINTETNTT